MKDAFDYPKIQDLLKTTKAKDMSAVQLDRAIRYFDLKTSTWFGSQNKELCPYVKEGNIFRTELNSRKIA